MTDDPGLMCTDVTRTSTPFPLSIRLLVYLGHPRRPLQPTITLIIKVRGEFKVRGPQKREVPVRYLTQ